MNTVDIVELITNNPITKLSETHNNKLLNKVKTLLMNHNNNYLYQVFIVI